VHNSGFIEFDLRSGALTLAIYQIPILPQLIKSRIPISVPDLLGSEIRVGFEEIQFPGAPGIGDYKAVIQGSKVNRFELQIGSQLFVLPAASFKRIKSEHGSFYSWRMPESQLELDKLLKQ
jgi:hypothetical protein